MQQISKRDLTTYGAAATVAFLGLALATVGGFWVAGSLGISTAAASQIVAAIAAGGLALRAVIIIFGAGIIGAIAATVLTLIIRRGRAYAIA